MSKNGAGKFLLGLGIGAGLGILFAPKSGAETRRELGEKIKELYEKAKEIDAEDVKAKIEELKKEIKELDKEKVLAIAKKKGTQIKDKATELVALAKEKGTPVLEKAADEVRDKAIVVVQDVLDRLEKSKAKKAKAE